MRSFAIAALAGLSIVVAVGCAPEPDTTAPGGGAAETMDTNIEVGDDYANGDIGDDGLTDSPLIAADDSVPLDSASVLTVPGSAITTTNLNLRSGPSTSSRVLAVIPSGATVSVLDTDASNGFYNVEYNGVTGYAHGNYLSPVDGDPDGDVDVDGPPSPANAMARAKLAVGFSYYWGGGAWLDSGPTSSSKGSCSGSCPSCTHSGRYGADCSGLVAKAWQFGKKPLDENDHPYGTTHFVRDTSNWTTISRSSMKPGDALVYNNGRAGHIVVYEKGDAWGSPTVIECRGCSYGCVRNARSFNSTYHGIRRTGF